MLKTGTIYGINGPVIYLKGNTGFRMSEMVYVGHEKLVGEVISLDKDLTTIQVYEETTGLRPGEEVTATGSAVSVTLAPGILNNIFDGIERPLEKLAETGGAFITRGVSVDNLDRTKKWSAHLTVSVGDYLHGGDIIAEVPETRAIVHKCMVPPDLEGTVLSVVPDGEYTIDEVLVVIDFGGCEKRADDDAALADPCGSSDASPFPGIHPACNRTAYHRYDVPDRKRRYGCDPGRIRNRKDNDAAPDRKMV